MDARSPWEHIGGALLLAALIFCFYAAWALVALTAGVGSICIWLGACRTLGRCNEQVGR